MNGPTNIQTAVRIRPYISWEKNADIKPLWQVKENSIVQILDETFTGESYTFDHIFEETKTNQDVYCDVVKPLVVSCLQGINATIFAYGQTSSGKTHTMLGDKGTPGIIGLAVDDVFRHMEEKSTDNFILRCSYLEIYNEKINDLLHPDVTDLKIREDINQGVHVIVKEEIIRTPDELFTLMKKGMKTRKVGSTDMNERSSRSHSIFKLVIQSQSESLKGSYTESTLSLVDLAGSERVGQMKMGKDRQLEGVSINKSLTALGLVIRKLSEGDSFINYRDSKLTRILQHSLGGNSKTLIIATITVAVWEETKSTLDFAHRAKFVKNRPVVNRKVTDKDQLKEYESLCQNYKVQIEKLTVEKLDHEKKINALEGKIQCIEKFSDFEPKSTNRSRAPSRRHTLAHFEPASNAISLPFSLLSTDEESFADGEFCTPLKSTRQSNESETDVLTPNTVITRLKIEKELADQSYENLVLFTNLENHLKLEGDNALAGDEFNEMRALCDRLRHDNLRLRESRPIVLGRIEYFRNQLKTLQKLLEGPVERHSEHLYTIPEETPDYVLETTEFTAAISSDDDKVRFQQELRKKDQTINALKAELINEKVRCESRLTEMNEHIEKLNSRLMQDMKTKEARLDNLHSQLSEDRQIEEEVTALKNDLGVLERGNQTLSDKNLALEHELRCAMLDLDEKSQLYDTILRNYSQKTTLAQTLEIEVGDLQSQVEDFSRTSSAKDWRISNLEGKVHDLRNVIANLQTDNDKLLAEVDNYSSTMSNDRALEEELNNKKVKCEFLVTEMNKLREDVAVKNAQIEKLNSRIMQDIKTKEAELDILNSKIEKLAVDKEELRSKLSEYRQIEQEIKSARSMQQENATLKDNLDGLEQVNQTLSEKNLVLEHQLHCAMLDLDQKSQHYDTISKNYSEKSCLAEALEVKVHELQSQVEDFNRTSSAKDWRINKLEREVEESVLRAEQAESKVMDDRNKLEELLKVIANVQADNGKLLADVDNYLKKIQSLQAIVHTQTSEIAALRTKLQTKTKSFDENAMKSNKIVGELEQIRSEKESLAQQLQETKLLNSQLRDINIGLKSDDRDKLRTERDSLAARNQELEQQVVDLEISLRKRVQMFSNLSLHLKELQQAQKEGSLRDARKTEPERRPQIEPAPVSPKKPAVQYKQVLTMADLFGYPANKIRVRDSSSQTEDKWQVAQQLDQKSRILDKLTAALRKSKFEFKSRTLEDQIEELLKRAKAVVNQEPVHSCCKSEERKSAPRVSDEMRKVKERRQSTYDQRRGLSGDVERSFSLDDWDCESCTSLRNKAMKLSSQIATLTDQVNELKFKTNSLDKENDDMLQIIKNYRERESELGDKLLKYEQCTKVDQQTQATCNLQEKYNALKRLVKLRKLPEVNTESLNLPPPT